MSFQLPAIRIKVMSRCLLALEPSSMFYYLKLNSGIGHLEAFSTTSNEEQEAMKQILSSTLPFPGSTSMAASGLHTFFSE